MIKIFSADTTDFSTNGLTTLDKCINPQIVEELNGGYSFTMQYPIEDKIKVNSIIPASPSTDTSGSLLVGTQGKANLLPKSNNIQKGNIIFANGQPFRIYYVERDMNYIYISARHIFYDLLDNFLEDVRPTNLSGAAALGWILTHTQYVHPFTSIGDVGGTNTKYFVRKNPVAAIMGDDGIIANWGGELVRDKFSVGLWQSSGNDNGVLIMGGKNITGIKDILDDSEVITRLMPVGKDGLLLAEKYIDSPYIGNYTHPKIGTAEFPDIQDEATLRTIAQKYMLDNKIDIPSINYSIDFIDVSQTEEYKNYSILQSVEDGDTVTVRYKKLNIDIKAKVIKTVKKYIQSKDIWVNDKVELGDFKPNLATGINKSVQAATAGIVAQVTSAYQEAIDNATALITGTKGGNVIINKDANGHPIEILIMDTTDINTAVNVWRWNSGGFGHSSTGYNGAYGTAITADGHIVGSFITALVISATQIQGGTLTLGGTGNGNGSAVVKDSLGRAALTLDKDGITMDMWYAGDLPTNHFLIRDGATQATLLYVTAEGEFDYAGPAAFASDVEVGASLAVAGNITAGGVLEPSLNNVSYCGINGLAWKACYAYAFTNPSSRELKENIIDLDTAYAYDAIKTMIAHKYNYIGDAGIRTGIITDEAPEDVLDSDKKAVDIYAFTTFLMGALQESIKKAENLEERVQALESKIV